MELQDPLSLCNQQSTEGIYAVSNEIITNSGHAWLDIRQNNGLKGQRLGVVENEVEKPYAGSGS